MSYTTKRHPQGITKDKNELKHKVKDHVDIPSKDIGKCKDLWTAKDKNENLLISLRDAIKGELEAILLYEHFIENISDNYLIDIISRIIYDEKEHTEELTLALTLLDKSPYGLTDSE